MPSGPSRNTSLRSWKTIGWLRSFTPAELQAHIATLGDPGSNPVRQMQLALALSYTHQPPDTARALGLTKATGFVNVLEAGYMNSSTSGEPRENGYEIELALAA